MTDDLQTIGEMCREFGVTPRTLRFYEAKELLAPLRQGRAFAASRVTPSAMSLPTTLHWLQS